MCSGNTAPSTTTLSSRAVVSMSLASCAAAAGLRVRSLVCHRAAYSQQLFVFKFGIVLILFLARVAKEQGSRF